MYKGTNKTALFSQKLIGDAMLRLLENTPFAEISVSDLCKEADVSRQTFYSLFGSKENVIAYTIQNSCCYIPEDNDRGCRSASFTLFCRHYSAFIVEHRHLLELLVRNGMMHFLYDAQYSSFMGCEHFFRDVTGDSRVYLVDFIAGGMNGIAKNYVLTGCRADEDYLAKLMYRLFGGLYFTHSFSD